MQQLRKGGLRLLTTGEIQLASTVFRYCIQYHKVWIHFESYLPFNLQNLDTAMTPNGEIWFQDKVYRDDYSISGPDLQHIFIHEMMHVYQQQRGMFVRTRGLFSWAADYFYDLTKKNLSHYSMEQQACIIADYWLLLQYGFNKYSYLIKYKDYNPAENVKDLIKKYQQVIQGITV
ncbi:MULTISPECIES: type IV secretion protein Rhs [Atlantibacter]|uniref:type IV secretion protein Rhs n=1 Tax=Atlantibacter TaxID=1903434 RepID=UPI00160585EF|nr:MULTISPECIES: type IV secretion protein Rhs [Atlantibacter]MBB3321286.1 hypothetical protein [Atlantibacter sp. RC6]MCZ7836389.1 type IV secretion protein Rhs [Atlantibacter hermannii]